MRNMLALFAAAILTVVGLGWYLGWYKVRSQPASVPGQHSVQIDINTKKIGKDIQQGEQKIQQMIDNKAKEEAANAKKTSDNLMLPSPPSSASIPAAARSSLSTLPCRPIAYSRASPLMRFLLTRFAATSSRCAPRWAHASRRSGRIQGREESVGTISIDYGDGRCLPRLLDESLRSR